MEQILYGLLCAAVCAQVRSSPRIRAEDADWCAVDTAEQKKEFTGQHPTTL